MTGSKGISMMKKTGVRIIAVILVLIIGGAILLILNNNTPKPITINAVIVDVFSDKSIRVYTQEIGEGYEIVDVSIPENTIIEYERPFAVGQGIQITYDSTIADRYPPFLIAKNVGTDYAASTEQIEAAKEFYRNYE